MFFKVSTWLVIELVLILLFMINAVFVTKRVFSAVSKAPSRAGAIDIEGKVMEDNNSLPSSSA
jgi:flagellar biogenesis protein FliO